jgi:hypothetical protein
MEVTLHIPDDIAKRLSAAGEDMPRRALEAIALEGYRAERLSESAVRQMLGFETRIEVHAFLKQHGVYLHYDVADLEQDEITAQGFREKIQEEKVSGKPRSG